MECSSQPPGTPSTSRGLAGAVSDRFSRCLWHRENIGSGHRRRCQPSPRCADRARCHLRSRRVGNRRAAKAAKGHMHMNRTIVTRVIRIVFLVWLILTAGLLWQMLPRPVRRPAQSVHVRRTLLRCESKQASRFTDSNLGRAFHIYRPSELVGEL